jgi:hypothetical protein
VALALALNIPIIHLKQPIAIFVKAGQTEKTKEQGFYGLKKKPKVLLKQQRSRAIFTEMRAGVPPPQGTWLYK